ncbi:hypothetical protein HK096_010104, partial [Nowakowskiella sp. JEL0078]
MKCKAKFPCVGDGPEELSFSVGAILINVSEAKDDGWFHGTLEKSGEEGIFPGNYVDFIEESVPRVFSIAQESNDDSSYPRPLEQYAKPGVSVANNRITDPLVRDKLKEKSDLLISKAYERLTGGEDDVNFTLVTTAMKSQTVTKPRETSTIKSEESSLPSQKIPLRAAQPPSRPIKPAKFQVSNDPISVKPEVISEFPGDRLLKPSELKARNNPVANYDVEIQLSTVVKPVDDLKSTSSAALSSSSGITRASTFPIESSKSSYIQPTLLMRSRTSSSVNPNIESGAPKGITSMSIDPLDVGHAPPPLPTRRELPTMPPRPGTNNIDRVPVLPFRPNPSGPPKMPPRPTNY